MGCGCSKATKTQPSQLPTKPKPNNAMAARGDMAEFETKEYPDFPADCKSLLKKYLTREYWDKMKGEKDAHGFTLGMAINSGVKNFDSGIGVYAGSPDSYTKFGEFFDQIVEDYHQFKKSDNHVSDMDYGKLKDLPNLDPDNKFINSTRIRVARNMANVPLGTLISKEQRREVESHVIAACESFDDELKGKYYKLGEMTKEQQTQLIEDHFLFKEGDRFLQACGLNRDWPDGRGIFHNDKKTFLIWINEEDQLRIISMENGGDIPGVHIKLPLLSQDKDRFNKIADQFFVQIRGIHGEHSESEGGVYDISNKRRLGRSEVELTMDMYNGVKAMIDAEKELMAKK